MEGSVYAITELPEAHVYEDEEGVDGGALLIGNFLARGLYYTTNFISNH